MKKIKAFFQSLGNSCKKFKENFYRPATGKINWTGVFAGVIGVFLCVFVLKLLVQYGDKLGIAWLRMEGVTLYTPSPTPFNEYDFKTLLIRQPWNTVSSFAYIFFAIYLLFLPWKHKETGAPALRVSNSAALRFVYAFALVVTGLGSAFMHMSLTFAGQICDVVGMYLVALFLILYAFRNVKGMSRPWFYIPYVIGNAVLLVTLIFVPDTRRYLFAVLIVVGLICEVVANRGKMDFKYLVIGCVVMLAGYAVWQLDQMSEFYVEELGAFKEELGYLPGLFFSRTGIFQGHTVWHVCGAVASFFLFKHYLAEDVPLQRVKNGS